MPAKNLVSCPCPACKGLEILPYKRRLHISAMIRSSSASVTSTGISSAPSNLRPISSTGKLLNVSRDSDNIPLAPDLSEVDCTPWLQPTPLEQEMLDHGTMSPSDVQLEAPTFGQGIENPQVLLAYVDHHERLNATMARAATPLTSYRAHTSLPGFSNSGRVGHGLAEEIDLNLQDMQYDGMPELVDDEEVIEFTRLGPISGAADLRCEVPEIDGDPMEDESAEIGEGLVDSQPVNSQAGVEQVQAISGTPLSQAEVCPGLAGAAPGLENMIADRWDALMRNQPWHNTQPDAFIAVQSARDVAFPNLHEVPLHLLCIYTIVPWLHLQFALPVAAANVLLLAFSVVLALVCPGSPAPFLTLKKVNTLMGLDVPYQSLAVCGGCKEVYPNHRETPPLCILCQHPLFKGTKPRSDGTRVPVIRYPYLSLSEQIERLLQIEGMESLLDEWRTRKRQDGVLRDIFDGSVHAHGPRGELRIGLQWAADWFSYLVSNIAPSHSSCPTSFAIANLPPAFRYRTANLLLTSILPGPKEQSGDELQRFIHPISGHHPVQKDRIKQEDKATPEAFIRGGARYARLDTQAKKDRFVKEHATRYTELSRLPYFNIVEQIVIDPMHNLFLGLVKTHFYHIWVQMGILRENHELRKLHEMLQDVCSAFRLPACYM
ncbi:hypothetical protein BV20DRAFT_978220 [Pilatotrama ljubarskyi]|nr:hypothetical protein BV20DRAFT_978220 [Pilatotrama ljubarskyi]